LRRAENPSKISPLPPSLAPADDGNASNGARASADRLAAARTWWWPLHTLAENGSSKPACAKASNAAAQSAAAKQSGKSKASVQSYRGWWPFRRQAARQPCRTSAESVANRPFKSLFRNQRYNLADTNTAAGGLFENQMMAIEVGLSRFFRWLRNAWKTALFIPKDTEDPTVIWGLARRQSFSNLVRSCERPGAVAMTPASWRCALPCAM
jgi:hypothetical protein